jgi:hypothetical protein
LRARKGILTFPPRVCSIVIPLEGKGNFHLPGSGEFVVESHWWAMSAYSGHLASPSQAWRMWYSKLATVSRVLKSVLDWKEVFNSRYLTLSPTPQKIVHVWYMAKNGYILWLIVNEAGTLLSSFISFYA